jgi:S1-C subfamily serine protease
MSYFKLVINNKYTYDGQLDFGFNKSQIDAAVLKVPNAKLVDPLLPLSLGNSDLLIPGMEVKVIGNPLTAILSNSVSIGYVSKTNVNFLGNELSSPCFSVSAVVNHGNSGGPVLNYANQVVGILTYGIIEDDQKRTVHDVSGALNLNFVLNAVNKYVKSRSVSLPYFGLTIKSVAQIDYKTWQRLALPNDVTGVYVYNDSKNQISTFNGKVITKINQTAINSTNEFYYCIQHLANINIKVTYLSENKEKTTNIVLPLVSLSTI